MTIRVGMGFDTHPLKAGRDFWLGGVKLIATKGPVGHSDADVLIHAICDALLGAASLGDIGSHFPDTDVRWQNMDSKFFLKQTIKMVAEKGWCVENMDCTVCLERPAISPYIIKMKQTLAQLIQVDESAISVKATTNERMGYVGREEGINAYAVVLIKKAG